MRKVLYIDRELFAELLECAKEMHPKEFIVALRGKKRKKGQIKELIAEDYIMLPFSISGRTSAVFNLSMIAYEPRIIGIVHSHPTGSILPSRADLENFLGEFVGIIAYPYEGPENFAVYDRNGQLVDVVIV